MYKVILLIITYLYIFSPILPSLKIGGIKLLYFLIPVLFTTTAKRNIIKTKKVLILFFIFFFYIIVRGFFSDSDTSQLLYDGTITFVEAFFIAHIVIYLHEKYSMSLIYSLNSCLYIASFSAILCLLSPPIKSFVESTLSMPNIIEGQDFRGYGIGCEQTFSYSISIAIIYSTILFWQRNVLKSILLLPFIAVSILINARTGFVILCLGFLLFLIEEQLFKSKKTIVSFIIIGLVLLNINISNIAKSDVGYFVLDFFEEMGAIISGKSSDVEGNTLTILLKAFEFYLPSSLAEWFWGPGLSVGDDGKIIVLDSGFFHELYFGGIFFIFLCFLIPFSFYKKIYDSNKYYALFILITCIIANIKGPFVPMAHGFKLISLICMCYFLSPPYKPETNRKM